ncbi:hypothetical protein ALT785_480005 [Alteromonas infernus]
MSVGHIGSVTVTNSNGVTEHDSTSYLGLFKYVTKFAANRNSIMAYNTKLWGANMGL